VIESLKTKSSSGNDGLSTLLLKHVKLQGCDVLTIIVNQSLSTGIFPNKLKVAKVIPIHKGKSKNDISNYRPISMLPSVSKVFERVMHDQVYSYFNSKNLLYRSQYGFRKSRSTELAALELVESVLQEMDKSHMPINIYLDLSKAFDTLDHEILLYKLNYYGMKESAIDLFRDYLHNRHQYVHIENTTSIKLPLQVGVPQGSILGPLLFIIYVNDMVNSTKAFHPIVYADDTTLAASLNTLQLEDPHSDLGLNTELQSVNNWMKANKLSINKDKTKAMVFHTPQRRAYYPQIKIDNVDIEYVDQFNFLGIIIDKHINWKAHGDFITKKLSKTLGIISRVKNIIPCNTLLNIYNSLVLSHLNYGLLLWGWKCQKVLVLQKKIIRALSNSKYNSHTSPIFKNLNLLKFPDICRLHDMKFCHNRLNNILPEYFNDALILNPDHTHPYLTRSSHHLRIPQIYHEFARQSIRYRFVKTLNGMSDQFKSKLTTHSLQGFKSYVKKSFLSSYSMHCDIINCYVCLQN